MKRKMIIHNAGLLTTVQDKGRCGYQKDGIPTAGVMDSDAHCIANMLVGNARYEAVLEVTMIGPVIEFIGNCVIAVTGASFDLKINENSIEMNRSIQVVSGDVLSFNNIKHGMRAYLAVQGGFEIEPILGSLSTYIRGCIGGYKGRALKRGDVIYLNESIKRAITDRKLHSKREKSFEEDCIIRVIKGEEENMFSAEAINQFYSSEYVLSNACDRMGYKLNGQKIKHIGKADILSSGLTLGAIQIPGHGEPIIMMVDHQTTGGYARIANVIAADIAYLAQLKPGCKVKFSKIDIKTAHKLLLKEQEALDELEDDFARAAQCCAGNQSNYEVHVNRKKFNLLVQEINKN